MQSRIRTTSNHSENVQKRALKFDYNLKESDSNTLHNKALTHRKITSRKESH